MENLITSTLLAFNADIFGEHMWNMQIFGMATPARVECRMDPWLIPILRNVLAIQHRVSVAPIQNRQKHMHILDVNGIMLSILGRSIKQLEGVAMCHIDVMLLAMTRNSLYVRISYSAFEQHPEVIARGQIAHLLDRIRSRRFCLLPGSLESEDAMDMAVDLVMKGWTMDAMIVPTSWIIHRPTTNTQGTCAICRDDICSERNDLVITLHCGHSFHVTCPDAHGSLGFKSWFQDHEKRTCPMCRASV